MTITLRRDSMRLANLRSLIENHGKAAVLKSITEALELGLNDPSAKGALFPERIDFKELAEAVWPTWREDGDPSRERLMVRDLREDAVDSTMFVNISGPIVFSATMKGFVEADGGVFEKLCTVIPTKFSGEKIPGISMPAADGYEIAEGAEYDQGTLIEDWIETPVTTKKGQILLLTKEAIFFDRTAQLIQQAQAVGKRLATKRLKAMLRVVLGIVNPFKWKGTAYSTYQGTTPWVNRVASGASALVDWTDINELMLVMARNNDPNTGEPIEPMLRDILVAPALAATAKRILNATEIRTGDGASQTAQVVSSNPVAGMITNIIVSQQMEKLLDVEGSMTVAEAAASYIVGDFKRAFAYMENWPITPETLAAGSSLGFMRDVVAGFKASERGIPAVMEPRAVVFQSAIA